MAADTGDIQGMLSLIAAIGGPIGAYWGAISAVRVELARMEERLGALQKAFDSDHASLDALTDRVHTLSRCDK